MRLVVTLLWMARLLAASSDTPVDALISTVRTAIEKHTADSSLAKTLRKLVPAERLELRTIEELESLGAGPESVAVLYDLRELSAGRKPALTAPLLPPPTAPNIDEQRAAFREITRNAIKYSAGLPDFICTQSVHRYSMAGGRSAWQQDDSLTIKLTYFGNREKYELTHINGRPAARDYESSGGAVSEGDFGSMLIEIFIPATQTKFLWDHWTFLRNRLTHVYSYRTPREHSNFRIAVSNARQARNTVIAARSGFIYADAETHMVMRITGEAEEIPPGYPIIGQSNMVDYDFASVGGVPTLLPLRAEQRIKTRQMDFKNITDFHAYRKFAADSTITFDK